MDLPCAKKSTRQSMDLPCVFFKPGVFVVAHGKVQLCRVPDRKHTANIEFPVVDVSLQRTLYWMNSDEVFLLSTY